MLKLMVIDVRIVCRVVCQLVEHTDHFGNATAIDRRVVVVLSRKVLRLTFPMRFAENMGDLCFQRFFDIQQIPQKNVTQVFIEVIQRQKIRE